MYAHIISVSTLWLVLNTGRPTDSPATAVLFAEKRDPPYYCSQFFKTFPEMEPGCLRIYGDTPFVWLLDTVDEETHEEADLQTPVQAYIQVFKTTWFNIQDDMLWNADTTVQLRTTHPIISTPQTPKLDVALSDVLPDAALMTDICLFVMSCLIQRAVCRYGRLVRNSGLSWTQPRFLPTQPIWRSTGKRRRRRSKKVKKRVNSHGPMETTRKDLIHLILDKAMDSKNKGKKAADLPSKKKKGLDISQTSNMFLTQKEEIIAQLTEESKTGLDRQEDNHNEGGWRVVSRRCRRATKGKKSGTDEEEKAKKTRSAKRKAKREKVDTKLGALDQHKVVEVKVKNAVTSEEKRVANKADRHVQENQWTTVRRRRGKNNQTANTKRCPEIPAREVRFHSA